MAFQAPQLAPKMGPEALGVPTLRGRWVGGRANRKPDGGGLLICHHMVVHMARCIPETVTEQVPKCATHTHALLPRPSSS